MPAAATKCLRCNTVQGWGRFAVVSGTTLALLTALITVTEHAAPTLLALWRGAFSEIRATPVDTVDNTLRLLVVNDGTRAGVLQESSFILRTDSGRLEEPLDVRASVGLIKPGEARELTLVLNEMYMPKMIAALSENDPHAVDPDGRRWMRVFPAYSAHITGSARNFDGSAQRFSWPVKLRCDLNSCGFELP
ncbi:hypothetical protein [Sphingomonas sp.]|uniref:hypothetical protein n=1 Tax=Sphingomonas sp. TaxID=28214 RepID=UPI003AFFFB36